MDLFKGLVGSVQFGSEQAALVISVGDVVLHAQISRVSVRVRFREHLYSGENSRRTRYVRRDGSPHRKQRFSNIVDTLPRSEQGGSLLDF